MATTNPVRVLIELDLVPECTSYREGVVDISDDCKDEIVAKLSDHASMVYITSRV